MCLVFKSTNHLSIVAFPVYRVSVLQKQACLAANRAINTESTGIWNHSIMTDSLETALTLMRRSVLQTASGLAGSYHTLLGQLVPSVNSWCSTSLGSLLKSHVPCIDQLFKNATHKILIIKWLELLYYNYKTGVALSTNEFHRNSRTYAVIIAS